LAATGGSNFGSLPESEPIANKESAMPTDGNSMRPLSDRLADLSQRAKNVENAFATARTENKQKLEAEIAQARVAVEQFRERVQQDAATATDRAKEEWADVQGRIAKRVAKIKADVEVRKQEFTADRVELRADLAADDASGAIEYARFAVLRAAAARADANAPTR
jgi:hypothetical protein